MRVLALDIGDSRIGVAVSDPAESVATPVAVLSAAEVLQGGKAFRRLIEDWDPELLVCGLPLTLSGEEGPQARSIKEKAFSIAKSCGLPLEFCDERLSSTEAKHRLRDLGYDERRMRGKVDMIAAAIFLQSWLDSRHDS